MLTHGGAIINRGKVGHSGQMEQRSVLVTGASSGIGQAVALRLARGPWEVFAGVRKPADGERLAQAGGPRLHPVTLDITDEASISAAAAAVSDAVGAAGLSALVNNAGVAVRGPVEYLPLDEWRRQFEVNVIGQVAMTKAALPLLRRSPQGRVVFMGSLGGRVSGPLWGPYASSKHAIEAIAESLRHELRPAGIKVSVVEPGAVKTPIWDKAGRTADDLEASLPEEGRRQYADQIAAARRGMVNSNRTGVSPEEVAEVVEKALTGERPLARYLVGRGAQVMGVASRVLPDSLRDALVRKASE